MTGLAHGPQGLRLIFRPGISSHQFNRQLPHLHPRPWTFWTFTIPHKPRALTIATTATITTSPPSFSFSSSQPQEPLPFSPPPPSHNQPTATQSENPVPPPPSPDPPPRRHRRRRKPAATAATPLRLLVQTVKLLALLHLTSTYLVHSGAVEGPSMLPTIPAHGSSVVILSLHRLGRGIEIGDLVCFKNPVAEGDAVKRVLGMEGDYVLWDAPPGGPVATGRTGRTGERAGSGEGEELGIWQGEQENTMQMAPAVGRGDREKDKDRAMIQVPKGHVWLAGDNMTASRDSRIYGPVPMALIKGKVIAQWYPWSERKWFRNPISGTIGLDVFRKL